MALVSVLEQNPRLSEVAASIHQRFDRDGIWVRACIDGGEPVVVEITDCIAAALIEKARADEP